MFRYFVFDTKNRVVGVMPVEAPTVVFDESVMLSHVMLYCGDHPVCELPVTSLPDAMAASESITVDFGKELPIGYEVWNLCLRLRHRRIAHLFGLIQQAGVIIGVEKARKSVHNFYPQTPAPQQQAVQDEEQQPLRGWSTRRMVQRITERLVG